MPHADVLPMPQALHARIFALLLRHPPPPQSSQAHGVEVRD